MPMSLRKASNATAAFERRRATPSHPNRPKRRARAAARPRTRFGLAAARSPRSRGSMLLRRPAAWRRPMPTVCGASRGEIIVRGSSGPNARRSIEYVGWRSRGKPPPSAASAPAILRVRRRAGVPARPSERLAIAYGWSWSPYVGSGRGSPWGPFPGTLSRQGEADEAGPSPFEKATPRLSWHAEQEIASYVGPRPLPLPRGSSQARAPSSD